MPLVGVFVPIVALMIPIVVLLTKHQQRMAEILHGRMGDQDEAAALRQEIAELKALVHSQVLAKDDRPAPPPEPIKPA